jgi:hypothetical protein
MNQFEILSNYSDSDSDSNSNYSEMEQILRQKKKKREKFKIQKLTKLQKIHEVLKELSYSEEDSEISQILKKNAQEIENIINFKLENNSNQTFAQIAKKNIQDPTKILNFKRNLIQKESKSSNSQKIMNIENKNQEKQKNNQKTNSNSEKSRRLIVNIENRRSRAELMNDSFIYQIRNAINFAFLTEKDIKSPVIASIRSSQSNQSLILTTMENFNSDFLYENESIWKEEVEKALNSKIQIEKEEKWGKMVIHHIPINLFDDPDTGLEDLQEEIEKYNDISLKKLPIWLTKNRENRKYASILLYTKTEKEADLKYIRIAGLQLKVFKYIDKTRNNQYIQCSNCQKWGHFANSCKKETKCRFCAENHHSSNHFCKDCNKYEEECLHIPVKCINCEENHSAYSEMCKFNKKPKKQEKYEEKKGKRYEKMIGVVINTTKC